MTPPVTAARRPLLTAAIIVRDEADFLRRCLASVAPVCDQIVVVDTGSLDDSVDVATSFGAIVHHRPWDDDFAAARNACLDLATGEWILYIDADEQLEDLDPDAARQELLDATDAVSLRVMFRARPMFSPYLEFRLWRHLPDIRFHGRIHETMVPDITRASRETGLTIRESSQFRICHWGYEGDQTHKHLRNLPLLERRVVELPDRIYLWNHLGLVRLALGDADGARDAWDEGVGRIRQRGLIDRTDILVYGSLALHLVANGDDVTDLLEEMQRIAPWYHTRHWVAALHHRSHGRDAEALPHLEHLMSIGTDPIDPSLAYNNAMFTDWAWAEYGDALYQLGDLDAAVAVFEMACEERPDNRSFRARAIAMSSYADAVSSR